MWSKVDIDEWTARRKGTLAEVQKPVEEIINNVRTNGDSALFELTERFDKVKLAALQVSREEIDRAYAAVDPDLVAALKTSKQNIETFHLMQRPSDMWLKEVGPGLTLGVKYTPLDRIGAYIPGGRASYPSTVLMCAVPAKVAGVRKVICCTPPPINPLTLVAADLAGVDEIYAVGGAQAVAAMALGTESIAPVQKIVGPGNVFVTTAKVMLKDTVEIDFPAGPSEIAILADETAEPQFAAADIMAQAEHDPNAACILITTSQKLAEEVGAEIERMLAQADRKEIIEKSLNNAGYVVLETMDEAIAAINAVAAEHLSIQVADPLTALRKIKHAGSIFVGKYAPVAGGDYASGTNHVLPTAGYAATYSGLDVAHFMKRSSVQIIEKEGLELIGDTIETLSTAEGLFAHCNSVRIRRQN
ncbi:histidinol dehydrogenase [Candidatus Methanomassiliicoccus intestinalis]|uniref:histidinol dehydrogenase n=1 Tax=Candidatus Methanomassiliicoccus intestinalis TaxID=1406512 RepID=UPI0037DDCBD9